jgi:hypothetical protein
MSQEAKVTRSLVLKEVPGHVISVVEWTSNPFGYGKTTRKECVYRCSCGGPPEHLFDVFLSEVVQNNAK